MLAEPMKTDTTFNKDRAFRR